MKNTIIVIFLFISICFGEFHLNTTQVVQGNAFKITGTALPSFNVSVIIFNQHTYKLFPLGKNAYQVILGTTYETPAGQYPILIRLIKNKNKIYEQKYYLTVLPGTFKKSTLIISENKEKEGTTNWDSLYQENLVLGKAFRNQGWYKQWRGTFGLPIKKYQAISSPYGSQRIYKNTLGKIISTWAHRGLDYAAEIGTPVYAVNNGTITVAQKFTVHGTTIVLDHGQGVISTYNHMSKLLVKKGDKVKKGQLIAFSGNSGLTTGPHLHYGLSVNNVRINPTEWFEKEF